MTGAADQVIAKIVQTPHHRPSEAEIAVLLATDPRSLPMEKVLAMHFSRAGDFTNALAHGREIFRRERSSENAMSLAVMLRRLGRVREAIRFAGENADVFDPVVLAETLCMMHGVLGETDNAVRHGTEALRLKDAGVPSAPPLVPMVGSFDPSRPERNVISFSLWGGDRRYLDGARTNAIVARYLYPGWTPRFHIDASVPEDVREGLIAEGAEVVDAPAEWPAERFGLFWRFLVEDDPGVDVYLVRDADSVVNIRECAAVEDWLGSGRAFHVMRDLPTHAELILAGMWGARRGNLPGMRARVEAFLAGQTGRMGIRMADQLFLRREIWPVVRQHVLVHDAFFGFGEVSRFRREFELPGNRHVGQNDWIHRK